VRGQEGEDLFCDDATTAWLVGRACSIQSSRRPSSSQPAHLCDLCPASSLVLFLSLDIRQTTSILCTPVHQTGTPRARLLNQITLHRRNSSLFWPLGSVALSVHRPRAAYFGRGTQKTFTLTLHIDEQQDHPRSALIKHALPSTYTPASPSYPQDALQAFLI
jgi:hypothetical protein